MFACIDDTTSGLSVYDEAIREADRHKWIESQKRGRDLGVQALRDWFHNYWKGYCRCRRLEHVEGEQHWQEFGAESFGHLRRTQASNDALLSSIMNRIRSGEENLTIIVWAQGSGQPVERVLEILAVIDVNEARLDPLDV